MSPPANITLPVDVENAVMQTYLLVVFVTAICLFLACVSLVLSILGMRSERKAMKKLDWHALVRNDAFQIRSLILAMNLINVIFQLSNAIVYTTPPNLVSDKLCNAGQVVGNYTYAIFYELVYIFLLKKALVARRGITNPTLLYTVAMVLAVLGPLVAMPVFFAFSVQGWGSINFGMCFNNSPSIVSEYYMSITVIYAVVYVYVFVVPIRHVASGIEAANQSHAHQLRHLASKNAILALVGLVFQLATGLFYLLLSDYITLSSIYLGLVAVLAAQLDVMISSICCLLMTSAWLPRWMRVLYKDEEATSASVSSKHMVHATSSMPGREHSLTMERAVVQSMHA